MKNIHIIPTDKPSRLGDVHGKLSFFKDRKWDNTENWRCKNIYITSDKEIKEGDWFYNEPTNYIGRTLKKEGKFWICDNINGFHLLSEAKKIILTTDPELINYDVQAIDDEFLEWFVKNPSCESVKIITNETGNYRYFDDSPNTMYKIIIPQEEPKQETIEKRPDYYELVDKKANENNTIDLNAYAVGVEDGAKWQAENSCKHNFILTSEQGHRIIKCLNCNHIQII